MTDTAYGDPAERQREVVPVTVNRSRGTLGIRAPKHNLASRSLARGFVIYVMSVTHSMPMMRGGRSPAAAAMARTKSA